MVSEGELVVKLPKPRVDELVASGTGKPFDPGHGVMKEWVTIAAPSQGPDWAKLADEARQFVAAGAKGSRRRSA